MATNKLPITCFQLETEAKKVFYVRSNWKVESFKDLSGRDEKVICDLSITDCKSFWTRIVKLIDLKTTMPDNIRNIQDFCEATQAALSGLDKCGNYKLSCQIRVYENQAKLTWNWSMQQTGTAMALQFTLGSISLDPVSQFETVKMWEEWIDFFIKERNQLSKSKSTYEIRVNDLEEIKNQMQEKIEIITTEKLNNQALLMEKFKRVLNTKKKKVKKLMKVLNANGTIMPSELQTSSDKASGDNEIEEVEESSNEDESSKRAITRNTRGKSRSKPLSTEPLPPSKKTKLDELESKSTIASESSNEEQPPQKQQQKTPRKNRSESVLTKTFRGQVIKSRRMGRKPVTRSSNNSLDNLLTPAEESVPPKIDEVNEVNDDSEGGADDLLSHM